MNPREVSTIGAIIVSTLALVLFGGAYVVAYVTSDHTSISLLVGAVIAMASTSVNFWLGSSAGSQKKDQALQQQRQQGTNP